jgi:hypothetical protein
MPWVLNYSPEIQQVFGEIADVLRIQSERNGNELQ